MSNKESYLKAMFAPDGKAVYVPVDHGIGGIKKGLEDPVEVIQRLLNSKIDGTLLQLGMAKQTMGLFEAMDNPPAKIIALDYRHYWKIPGHNQGILDCFQSCTVEQAMAWGCTGVKVMIPYGQDEKVTIQHVRILAQVVREADRRQVPVMVEPMPSGKCPPEYANDHQVVANAARIAIEMGADVLKLPYTGNKEQFAHLVQVSRIPVTVLGGSPKDVRDLLQSAREIMDCGARAVVFGRNVWGHPKMEQVVAALREVVHQGGDPDGLVQKYQLHGRAVTDQTYTI